MTEEEAIKMIARIADEDGYTKEAYEALSMAIEALEKQIPKKPYDVICCPNCKLEVPLQPIDTTQKTFCMYCGQAIDWSDVE